MATKIFNIPSTGGGQLYWPANIESQFDYLEMEILRFSQRNILKRDISNRNRRLTDNPTAFPSSSVETFTASQQSGESRESSTTNLKTKGKILLPIPDNVSYTDAPQWSDQSVNALGRFGAQAIQEMMTGNKDDGAVSALQQAAEAGKVGVIKNILGKIGVDPNAVSQNIAGKIANPYLQQIFQGVGMRQFDFNWKLVPRNETEQESIKRIITTLRANVLPGFSDDFSEGVTGGNVNDIGNMLSADFGSTTAADGKTKLTGGLSGRVGVDRWLTLPNIFNLKWKYHGGEIDSLPKLKQCVCKNISVQYTPDGVWAARIMNGKPQPIAYNLTMSFGEMSIVTNSDVTNGF